MARKGTRKGDSDLILALARGETTRDAAKAAGVGERTAHRRLEDPAFRRRVDDARNELLERSFGRIVDGRLAAIDSLTDLVKNAKSETARLGAARALLEASDRLMPDTGTAGRNEAVGLSHLKVISMEMIPDDLLNQLGDVIGKNVAEERRQLGLTDPPYSEVV